MTAQRKEREMVDISIDSVLRVSVSTTEEYEDDEIDEDDDRFYRTITIETASGVIELDLNATSEADLVLLEEDEG